VTALRIRAHRREDDRTRPGTGRRRISRRCARRWQRRHRAACARLPDPEGWGCVGGWESLVDLNERRCFPARRIRLPTPRVIASELGVQGAKSRAGVLKSLPAVVADALLVGLGGSAPVSRPATPSRAPASSSCSRIQASLLCAASGPHRSFRTLGAGLLSTSKSRTRRVRRCRLN